MPRHHRRWGIALLLILLAPSAAPHGQPSSRLQLAGLSQPVEILRDPWGIAHIYAATERDLFFAQGYSAARDRLFQLELWRRQATGTAAEILGRRELQRDIGARLLKFRGPIDQELAHYHPRGETIITAFAEGVNAFIAETERRPELLPLEFRLLGFAPGRWTPEVVVSRHQGLFDNLEDEVRFAQAVRAIGVDRLKEIVYFHPGDPAIEKDPAIDLSLIGDHVLALYTAHRRPIRFTRDDIVQAWRNHPQAYQRVAAAAEAASPMAGRYDIGSNNWVVSGGRTQNGKPLMANDPHRTLQAPSLRYWAHLVAPGWNVIGAGEPALPGISIGHNSHGAWGLTIFGIDTEDLYVYETNPVDANQYRYEGAWEDLRIVRERIAVKGEAPVEVELKYSRHGPVLYQDADRHAAFALRAAWLEVGGAPYLASLRMNQATSWEAFREACAYSHTPAENMVWADATGTIGWQAVGIPPVRRGYTGLLPVPGDGRVDWDGFLPVAELPHVVNPAQGYWATANENLVPQGYPHRRAVGWNWADPYRAARVNEVLASGRRHSLMDMIQLQNDELSIPARTLVPMLAALEIDSPRTRDGVERLRAWDFVLDRDSVAAGIYVAWERRLLSAMRDLVVPESARAHLRTISMKRMLDWLAAPDGRFGRDPLAGRNAFLLENLDAALDELAGKLGPDPAGWRYGQPAYKHALIRHPLSGAVAESHEPRLDVGPAPRGGNSFTVNNTSAVDNQASGGSFKIVVDTGNWDHSVGMNSPGQSGDPRNPHYRDLFELWARGQYFPVLFSRDKIEAVARERLLLEPAAPATAVGRSAR